MRADAEEFFSSPRGKRAVLIGMFLAPVTFMVHEMVNYIFVPWACAAAGKLPIYLMNAFCMLLAAIGFWTARRNWQTSGSVHTFELGGPIGRTRFMAFCGMLVSGLFFLAIIATALPNWIMSACTP